MKNKPQKLTFFAAPLEHPAIRKLQTQKGCFIIRKTTTKGTM